MNSPCQSQIKCIEKSIENMGTDVRLLRVKGSTASSAWGYLTASQFVSALLHPQEEDAFGFVK